MPIYFGKYKYHFYKQKIRLVRFCILLPNPKMINIGLSIFIFFFIAGELCAASESTKDHPLIKRKILALYKTSENQTKDINEIYLYFQLPLNHLGLVVDYANAEKELPDIEHMKEYRGVISCFYSDQMKNAHRYRSWLYKILTTTKIKVLILGQLGAYRELHCDVTKSDEKEVNDIFNLLELKGNTNIVEARNVKVNKIDKTIYDYETKFSPENVHYLYDVQSANPANHVLLRLSNGDMINDAAVLTSKGGYIQSGAIYKEIIQNQSNSFAQLYINPFVIFQKAFDWTEHPILDINTIGNKRIAFIHIDGDGFSSFSRIRRWHTHTCAHILNRKIIQKFPLPFSVSVIASEVDPSYLGDRMTLKTAREIFRQPNVEPASHSFAHPFDWRKKILEVDSIPGYHFDGFKETVGSIRFIQNQLLTDDKKIRAFFWSGKCNPLPEYIQLVEDQGIYQINGGFGKYNKSHPSITSYSPPYAQIGNQFRINSRITNDYEFTNYWRGPNFDGFKNVIETLQFSNKYEYLTPADIYFHFYIMERKQSWQALKDVLQYAAHQDWSFVYVSQYIQMVQALLDSRLYQINNHEFLIESNGYARTIKFPNENRNVHLTRSKNILGYTHRGQNLIVHLDGHKLHRIVLDKKKNRSPYLRDFNRMIDSISFRDDTVQISSYGYGDFGAQLQNVRINQPYKITIFDELSKKQYDNFPMLRNSSNPGPESDHTHFVQSDQDGTLEIEALIQNRSILIITPESKLKFVIAKIKFWVFGFILVGFLASQFVRIKRQYRGESKLS